MELDTQAVINEITRQRNDALNRCAILVSEIVMLRKEIEGLGKEDWNAPEKKSKKK